jgi:integrase
MQPILREATRDYKTANVFLSSMLRSSINSKYAYRYGLTHFQKLLTQKYPQYNIESILKPLSKNELDVYVVLDEFVSYLLDPTLRLTSSTTKLCIAAVRSYLAYYDIDIIPSKFKRKIKMPKLYREDEEPLDASDIRRILLSCIYVKVPLWLAYPTII